MVDRCYPCERDLCEGVSLVSRMETGLREQTGLTDFHEALVLKRETIQGAADAIDIDDRLETAIYSQPGLGKRINGRPIN